MNKLQLVLHSANEILSFHLMHSASRFPAGDSDNNEFFRDLAVRAKLTETERGNLESQKR